MAAPEVVGSTFVLAVTDLEKSRAFYVETLGFTEELSVEGWSFQRRGACRIRIGDCPDATPMSAHQDHSWFAYLHVTDARGLFAEFKGRGVEIWHPLKDTPWKMREFSIVTPDGHRMVFGQPL